MDNSRNNTYQKLADLHPLFSADAAARQIHGKGDIYGAEIYNLQRILRTLMERIEDLRARLRAQDIDPIEHCLGRIKDGESMREKLRLQGFPETTESALTNVYDAIGVRVVCAFLNDVYMVRDYILAADDIAQKLACRAADDIELIQEKDYIRHAKPNGYRSLHLIVRVEGRYYVEIQLRTISMDTWAALEHHMKYKKNLTGNTDLLVSELKRCADELASTDVSMQTLRDMIRQA